MKRIFVLALLLVASCSDSSEGVGGDGPDGGDVVGQADARPASMDPDAAVAAASPILFVHGVNGGRENFDVLIARLVENGWSSDRLFANTFENPSTGCNVDNAAAVSGWVGEIKASTGSPTVTVVAHSMGTLSSRYFIKNLSGTDSVDLYVTLGGMHHGLASSCSPDFPFKPCHWDELCSSKEFVAQLNEAPATPGEFPWVSIYGTADTVVPNASSMLDGAENISLDGVEHSGENGLLEHDAAFAELVRVLQY